MALLRNTPKLNEKMSTEKVQKEEESETEEESDDFYHVLEGCKVRFELAVKRYDVLNLEDYTEKEKKKSWYSDEDKEMMNNKHNKIVKRYESGKKCKTGTTYRGLECWTTEGAVKLDETIARVVDAVMDEQDSQWASGQDNWDRLAEISKMVSKECRKKARALGKEDEAEALQAQKESEEDGAGSDAESKAASIFSNRSKKYDRLKRSEKRMSKDGAKKVKTRKSGSKKKAAKMSDDAPKKENTEKIEETTTLNDDTPTKEEEEATPSNTEITPREDPPGKLERSHSNDNWVLY